MDVKLAVKLAEVVEGVDLSHYAEGDVINLPDTDGNLLIRGGWAERILVETSSSDTADPPERS